MKKIIAICLLCFILLSVVSCDVARYIPIFSPSSSTPLEDTPTVENNFVEIPTDDNSTDDGENNSDIRYIFPSISYVGEWCNADNERCHITVYTITETEMEFEITLKCSDNNYYMERCIATYSTDNPIGTITTKANKDTLGYIFYYDLEDGGIGIAVTVTNWSHYPSLNNTEYRFTVRKILRPDESILGLWDQGSFSNDTVTVYAYRSNGFDFTFKNYSATATVTDTGITFVSDHGSLNGTVSFGGDSFDVMYLNVYSDALKGVYRFEHPEFFEPTETEDYIEDFRLHNYSTVDPNLDIVINSDCSLYIRGIGDSAISLTYKYQWGSRVYFADENGSVIANILICERRLSRNASYINKVQCMVLTIDVGTVTLDERVFLLDFDGVG